MTEHDQRGSITIWMATASAAMTLLIGLAVDLGGQVHALQRAQDVAAQAARAGGERVQAAPAVEGDYVRIDALAAKSAAVEYLVAAHVDGTVEVTGGSTLTVHVTDSYRPRFFGVLGIGDLPVSASASARLVRSLGGNER